MANTYSNYKSEYFGFQGVATAGVDLIQKWKLNPNGKTLLAMSFDFIPKQNCTVIINGSDPIPFIANREWIIDVGVNPIHEPLNEFKIVESGIECWYVGIFKD